MNENGVRAGPIRFLRARTCSLLDAATVTKKANFPHAHADRLPAGNSLRVEAIVISEIALFLQLEVFKKLRWSFYKAAWHYGLRSHRRSPSLVVTCHMM